MIALYLCKKMIKKKSYIQKNLQNFIFDIFVIHTFIRKASGYGKANYQQSPAGRITSVRDIDSK